jgi:hypothetical protein
LSSSNSAYSQIYLRPVFFVHDFKYGRKGREEALRTRRNSYSFSSAHSASSLRSWRPVFFVKDFKYGRKGRKGRKGTLRKYRNF